MAKITKFPSALISGDCTTSSLVLDGGSIIDQCIVTAGERGTSFLEQHLLYVVLGGSVKLTCGRQSWTVGKNEMILLRRAQSVSYEKQGSEETGLFESQLFAIRSTSGRLLPLGTQERRTAEGLSHVTTGSHSSDDRGIWHTGKPHE
ncbi:MAG: hypothetical protein K5896_07895 [Prevotella sp.]|nr:hypothetical protein [Prevotella sp.]